MAGSDSASILLVERYLGSITSKASLIACQRRYGEWLLETESRRQVSVVYGFCPVFFRIFFQSVVDCLWVNWEAIKRFMIYLNLNSDLLNCLKMIWICFENNKWGIKGAIWFKYHDIHKKSWQFILENPILNPQDKKKSKRNREWTIFIKFHLWGSMLVPDAGDGICRWQLWDLDDRHQNYETSIYPNNPSSTSYNCHHHKFVSRKLSPTWLWPIFDP